MEFEVGLFAISPEGVTLVGRSIEPRLVASVRERIARERRQELAAIELPVRLVPDDHEDGGE